MKLTTKSKKLIEFFNKHKCFENQQLTKTTESCLKVIYTDINTCFEYVKTLKDVIGEKNFYNMKIVNITNPEQIQRPTTFPNNSIPSNVYEHINNNMLKSYNYNIQLTNEGKNINIWFLFEKDEQKIHISQLNKYVDFMLVWIILASNISTNKCSSDLNIYVYFTLLEKELPINSQVILNEEHVNTAFTRTCPTNKSEIVIFRKEEWFKVFLHETFHNFGLDFSLMDTTECHNKIRKLFNVNSSVNLYEAYSEFWARLMNVIFCSYSLSSGKSFKSFKDIFITLMNLEQQYSIFQMIKVLKFMDLNYEELIDTNKKNKNEKFRENTNVLSYYIITSILIFFNQFFILWCYENNNNLLQFKNIISCQKNLCNFIQTHYTSQEFIKEIRCMGLIIGKLRHQDIVLKNNLRMTLCELQ